MGMSENDLALHMWEMGRATEKKARGEVLVAILDHYPFSAERMRAFVQSWVAEADSEIKRLSGYVEDEMN